jgi:hypothetical protein
MKRRRFVVALVALLLIAGFGVWRWMDSRGYS